MAEIIRMPKMSDTMEEGVVVAWLKQEGDMVKSGDILAEIETDKATMELEAYEDGALLHIGVKESEVAPVNGLLAIIGERGEDITGLLKDTQQSAAQQEKSSTKEKIDFTAIESAHSSATAAPTPPITASPLAKKIAQEKGYDLAQIQGTGDGGRIIKRDVEHFSSPQVASTTIHAPQTVGKEQYRDVPLSGMRKTIAQRLSASKATAPHFYLTVSIDMDQAVASRTSINTHLSTKISFNDIMIKAAAMALRQHPVVNASWLTDKVRYNEHIHVGVAVALEDGLVVPVVRFADTKSLAHIATEMKEFVQRANQKQLKTEETGGNTFSISNLGMKGIDSFTAIINPPASCNLAIGAIQRLPVVKNGNVVPGHVMKLTLSCDHRVVDGAVGANFLQTFKGLLEDPIRLLLA